MDAFFCEAGHPRRPVAWRWRRAVDLVERPGRPFDPVADALVRQARAFWFAWSRCRGDADRRRVGRGAPRSSSRATNFIVGGGAALPAPCGRGSSRAARPKPSPAGRVWRSRSSPCSRQVFFDVRDRLCYPDFIQGEVIGPAARLSAAAAPGWAQEQLAYLGGELVADALLDSPEAGARPGQAAGVGPFLDDRLRAAVQRGLATLLQAPGGRGAGLAALARLLERWASPADASQASLRQRQLEEHIKAMIEEILVSDRRRGRGRGAAGAPTLGGLRRRVD